MNHRTVHLLDLPDEILLVIMKKLGSFDVLYSLLDTNKRLDRMARSINNTKVIDFSNMLPNDELSSINDVKLNRFCYEILPQIHHNVVALTLETLSIERILLACEYPNLSMIVLMAFQPDILLKYLIEGSPTARLFREQIRHITVKNRKDVITSRSYKDVCIRILAICTNLSYLNMNQWVKSDCARLSFRDQPPNVCFSSHLRALFINVITFNDCLCLLDGRLEQLSSFIVDVYCIKRTSMIDNNQKVLSNLKEFSLTSHFYTNAYDCRILSLVRRMPNLNTLTLRLDIIRLTVIDGIDLNEDVLINRSHLNTFIFHICTVLKTSETNHLLSTNDIQNTFINWKYSSVRCCVDHFSDGYTYCHIYSTPFKITRFMYLSNSFRGHQLQFVTNLSLYDTRPFEHDFFEWISRALPLLEYLLVHNLIPQENKWQTGTVRNKRIFSKISYLHLARLCVTHAHIDYANQFLHHTSAYLPSLQTLTIQYEKLVTVTNNFTNEATRHNCGQLKELRSIELLVYPEHFYLYFPSLIK